MLPPVSHPEADHMGSTIRAHEKTDTGSPATGSNTTGGQTTGPVTTAPQMMALTTGQPLGMDVSSYQGTVDWKTAAANGAKFVYIKATESTSYVNEYLTPQYTGSYAAGLIRGTYHFALPDRSSGATQAAYFLSHLGGWSPDGRTLPPMLDMEYNPYGATCYGKTPAQLTAWIADFSNTVNAKTGRYPTIYTTTDWWTYCTGNTPAFGATNPLFIARYASTPGTMPAGWPYQSIWQKAWQGVFPGDQDVFNGSLTQLQAFASGGRTTSTAPTPVPATVPAPVDLITARYRLLGGSSSFLGVALDSVHTVTGGLAQTFQYGMLLYSAATAVHEVHGAIHGHYTALLGPSGLLRLPTTDETPTPDGIGRYNHFSGSGGSIYWSPLSGAHEVHGTIAARWASLGWERGRLGYPTSDESNIAGGRVNWFAHGAITWNSTTGATTVWYS